MRFTNICLEGPDCSGKTTMFNKLHELTSFKYNIQDRSCLSMLVYSIMYNRQDQEFWTKLKFFIEAMGSQKWGASGAFKDGYSSKVALEEKHLRILKEF